ncbi:alpha/beta hydrolase [Natrarchaeobius sp. A-rgal3]|uniref:alpha/beta hydrolase n=1 Tax=Natrarchaeobius versutus TaxID=1679078 RepID=UPI003510BEE8
MSDVLIPGARDVRGVLEEPGATTADEIVVACPPHPQHGGSRSDGRLVAVSDALRESGIACLRFDYGPWDGGYGEREDVRNAVRWATDRYERTGVFGYSFGATQAILASADVDAVDAVSALAPAARLADDLEAIPALESVSIPVQIVYGERDTTVEWDSVVERAADRGDEVRPIPADHFFLGRQGTIADDVSAFFERTL